MMRAFLLLVLLAAPAHAADFSRIILDVEGTPMRICVEVKPRISPPECVRDAELTLARAARNALDMNDPITGDEKYKRGELAQTLTGEVKLKPEDATLLKAQIGKMFSPHVVFQAWQELNK